LHIRDYGVPVWGRDFWLSFAQDVKRILDDGKSVLVGCVGGHGRTGMVLAILLGVLTDVVDPIQYVRDTYCVDAIETVAQERYVKEILGL
jgi:protein-tyrosine phosphatase